MIGKLIKHEWLASRRLVPLIWLGAVAMAVVNGLAGYLDIGWLGNLSLIFLILLAIGQVLVTYVVVISRYYKSLYSAEGYLTHALPVPARALVTSKVLVSFGWLLASYLVAALLFGVVVSHLARQQATTVRQLWQELLALTGLTPDQVRSLLLLFMGFLLYTLLYQLSQFFFSITLGSLSRFHKLGLAGPILAYLAVNLGLQVLVLIGMLLLPIGLTVQFEAGQPLVRLVRQSMWVLLKEPTQSPNLLGLGGLLVGLVAMVFLFWGSCRLIEKHTSLR